MDADHTTRFYDAWGPAYYQEWKDNLLMVPFLRALVVEQAPHPRVLDLGCGPGCESKRLADIGATVVGIDASTTSLAIARRHAPEVTFLEMDIAHLDFSPGAFDAVLDSAALFHFSDDDQRRILKSVHRLLKAGGTLLSIYMTGDFHGLQERTIGGAIYRRYVNLKGIESWTALAREAGFDLTKPPEQVHGAFWAAWLRRP